VSGERIQKCRIVSMQVAYRQENSSQFPKITKKLPKSGVSPCLNSLFDENGEGKRTAEAFQSKLASYREFIHGDSRKH
jgi:hypothetical protein